MTSSGTEWAVALFKRSVLKQEKHRQIVSMLDALDGKICLDIGGDNGIISYLLRERGGDWHSADLDAPSVESIRQLVGSNVYQIDGLRTPFPDRLFDLVVIVDFLEHIHTDRQFAQELRRILKPGGKLIVNVPHLKPHSILNRIRHAIGLTDEKHGHVRPGYSLGGLRQVLGDRFTVEASRTYSKTFSEMVDTFLNLLYELLRKFKDGGPRSKKGTLVTQGQWERHRADFLVLSALYPVLRLIASLDGLVSSQEGYKLIVRASLKSE